MEMHYDVSGPGADNVELRVFRMSHEIRERIYSGTIQSADGYYQNDFVDGFAFFICFRSLDSEEKDLTFMVNQVTKGKVEYAQMDHLESQVARLKDLQDDFDVISHNLSARMNSDADMQQALKSAKTTQKIASGIKAAIVILMCALQTYFITSSLGQKQADAAPYQGLSGKAPTASKVASQKSTTQSDLEDKSLELV